MRWLDRWLYKKHRDMWDNRHKYEAIQDNTWLQGSGNMPINMGTAKLERGSPEGEDAIRFELSSAVGGKILTVRRYDNRTDTNNTQTYIIPTGENLGEKVAKIVNLEQYR